MLATITRGDIELNRQFTLGRVYRDGTTLHIRQSGLQLANFMRKEHERLYGRAMRLLSAGSIEEQAAWTWEDRGSWDQEEFYNNDQPKLATLKSIGYTNILQSSKKLVE